MSSVTKRTIANYSAFVISAVLIYSSLSACAALSVGPQLPLDDGKYMPPIIVGKIEDKDISESSGIAASKCTADVLWTHNDSGNEPLIYALGTSGKSLGSWRIPGVENTDWEDIAEYKDSKGKCFIYIGEIGDNKQKRSVHEIYRISEPTIESENSTDKKTPLATSSAGIIRFSYPDGDHNAESLMVHPALGDIYIVTKRVNGPAGVYRIKPDFDSKGVLMAVKVAEIAVPSVPNGLLTGGDISPDGKRVVLCDYFSGYEYTLPEESSNFDDVWKQKPDVIDIGKRDGGEAVCYSADGNSIFATSEGKKPPLIQIVRKTS